jgi:hypothetical protein
VHVLTLHIPYSRPEYEHISSNILHGSHSAAAVKKYFENISEFELQASISHVFKLEEEYV